MGKSKNDEISKEQTAELNPGMASTSTGVVEESNDGVSWELRKTSGIPCHPS